ncbi:MAG: hypothetical protein JW993_19400 [Sedimentisphaerales bacterium]|nr:hypothetical protein [Sedimentisphaerales bacterium]
MCKKLVCLALFLLLGSGLAGPARGGMVAWWTFDGNFDDASGNDHPGVAVGTPGFADGLYGQALTLSGSNQYLNCGQGITSTSLGDGGTLTGFTMAFWVNRAAAGDHKVCSDLDNSGWTNGGGIKAAIYNNRLEVDLRDSDQRYFSRDDTTPPLGTLMATNTWYHIAVVFDDAGDTMTIYLDGAVDRLLTVTQGMAASTHDFYIGADTPTAQYYFNGTIDDLRLYDSPLSQAEVLSVMAGRGPTSGTAGSPVPDDEATDVPRDVVLAWAPGEFAATHDVYFGTSFEDVNTASIANPLDVLVGPGQDANTFDPDGLLEFGTTYYWRVDEVNGPPDYTPFPGEVWSFTAEPFGYPIVNVTASASIPSTGEAGGPEKTLDGSGLDADGRHSTADGDMWQVDATTGGPVWIQYDFDAVYKLHEMHVWNFNTVYESLIGFGLKDITVEYSTEADDWMTLGDFQVPRAPGLPDYVGVPIDLGGIAAKSLRINVQSNWGGRTWYGLSEVRFYHVPVLAREPKPASGATDVSANATLDWRTGREAATHEVYFGTDEEAVVNGTAIVDSVAASAYDPGPLNLGTTYYWKINEVNEAEVPGAWESDVWSFSTTEYITIDGFEGYTDETGSLVYETWLDGFEVTGNGSQVGHDNPPYAEKTIVHGGRQSMPFYYENTGGVANSEIERTLAPAQDWTINGADVLSVYFRGVPAGFFVKSESNILMNGIGADIWYTADQFRFVYKRLSGNGSITARVDSLVDTHQWAKAGVMIRESLDPASAYALNLVSPRNGISFQYRSVTNGSAATVGTQAGLAAPYWVRITRQGNTFTAEHSADGVTWAPVTAIASTVDITMASDVYVGLAVCSVSTTVATGAEFSGIATGGTVSGQWQSADIEAEQPAGNGIDVLYLAVEDSNGRKATVSHPDAAAIGLGTWQQWQVPLSDLAAAGVNTKSIKKVYLGVGDKTKPSRDAAGLLYIDDLAFGHPIPTP